MTTDYLLFVTSPEEVELAAVDLERFIAAAERKGAGLFYGNYYELKAGSKIEHPTIDYQLGSVRDDFDLGPLILFSTAAVKMALKKYGRTIFHWAGFYDLRLKVSTDCRVVRIPEYFCSKSESDHRPAWRRLYDYLDPIGRARQKEMESAFIAHLKRIDAYLEPEFKKISDDTTPFPVMATVVTPVRNRAATVAASVLSAAQQRVDFPFNIIVVDDHSTDGTTDILRDLSRRIPILRHLLPSRRGLGIGGLWNEAIFSKQCGRYAIQLDSDDLYSRPDALQMMVNAFHGGTRAMVIGSYTVVDQQLKKISPGMIDHREWTVDNGRNNALRINGLGAPRGYQTSLLRKLKFPNVSYGEDYAVSLRISREYKIERIYESLSLYRRWDDNTDANLSVEQTNRNDYYKDGLRTSEMRARREMNLTWRRKNASKGK